MIGAILMLFWHRHQLLLYELIIKVESRVRRDKALDNAGLAVLGNIADVQICLR